MYPDARIVRAYPEFEEASGARREYYLSWQVVVP
jgi:hypothetical protein